MKSIAVVVGSYVLSIVLVLCTDPLLSKIFPGEFVRGQVPSDRALITSTVCFAIVTVICAWVCARFAPRLPGKHVMWLFVLGEVMGVVATVLNWGKGYPHWYLLSWLIVWPVCCWIGLKLTGRREIAAA